jgi:hypothetical protein
MVKWIVIAFLLMVVLLATAFQWFLKSRTKSVSSSLSAEHARALNESLARLDKVLAEKAKTIHSKLAPPATDADIERLRAELGGSTVESLELWYRWHNGMTDKMAQLLPLGWPISIDDAIRERQMMMGGMVSFFCHSSPHRTMIKILDDGFGDGYFLNTTSSNPTVFYDMMEDPGGRHRFTLAEFVDFIAEAYEQGILVDDPRNPDMEFEKFQRFEEEFVRKRRGEKS